MNKFEIISTKQFGFQQKKNTTDAVLDFVEYIYAALNEKKHILGITVDLRKAFDMVNSELLLKKLFVYGIRGIPLKLLRSYLSNRTQCVKIGSAVSKERIVSCGVPQGSVLGPLLFLLFINDLAGIENAHLALFADDATIACSHRDNERLISEANVTLSCSNSWIINNRLSLNIPKTAALLISNRLSIVDETRNLNISGVPVNFVSAFKFLGIQLDAKLNFKPHIDFISSKLSKSAGILHRVSGFVPESNMIKLYYSFIYPYLLYGILIWGNSNDTHLKPLVLLQKKIIRILTSSSYLSHTEPLFSRTKILKLNDLYRLYLGIYMFKKKLNNSIVYPSHSYLTRYNLNAVPTFQRLSRCQNSLTFVGPKQWNLIPDNIRNSSSLSSFKNQYRQLLLSKYHN